MCEMYCGSVMLKINIVFNGEFVAGNKSANKNIATRNYELFRSTDLQEWYELRVVELS